MGNQRAMRERKTIAVSATIWISVGKVHHQIRLRILSCSRVSENRRGPEVPEVKARVVECRDGLARITSEELAITHFVKNGTLQNACSTKNKNGCRFEEKCSFAHRQVDVQPTKWSKSNNDKSAVALLKKGDWHERGSVTDRNHDRSGKPDKKSDKKLGQKSSQRELSDARQLGCVFQDMTPPKSILRKSTDMPKTIQRVKFKKATARHTKIRDQNPSLGYICPGEPHERSPNAPKFEDRSQGRDRVARVRCPRSSVEAGQKCVQIKGARKSSILLVSGK